MQASKIVELAAREAKATAGPNGTGMLPLVGEYFTVVLTELKQKRDLMSNRVTNPNFIIPGGTYGPINLEQDYLRTYDLFYQIPTVGLGLTASSQTIFLNHVTMQQWDAEFKDPSVANYPYEFATDLSTQAQVWSGGSQGVGVLQVPGVLWVYPQTNLQITATHRYMINQPDIVNPETSAQTPWFADTDYLIAATAARTMGITGDARREEYFNRAEAMLRPYLIMEGDEQPTVKTVGLDPRKFKFSRGLRPTKSMPF